MSDKIILIKSLFSSNSLITRQAARDIFTLTSQMPENRIIIDFSEIQSASRSFFDELISYESKWKLLSKQVEFINISDQLIALFETVKNKSNTFSYSSYPNTSSASQISF